jgi:diguanylate cyclase (GGDEF)-like protein/PAS domain S-box-containing protein
MGKTTDTRRGGGQASSERHREERDSSDGEPRYHEIFEHVPVSIWVEDWSRVKPIIDGLARRGVKNWRRYFERRRDRVIEAANAIEVIDISAATLRIYGAKNKQEVIVSARGENMDPGELITFREQLASFAGAASRFEIDADESTMDNREIVTRIRAVIPPAHRDSWSRVYYAIEDITERKRTEKSLETQKTLFEAVFRDVPDAMVLVDPTRKIIMCNPGLSRIFGYRPEEVLGSGADILYENHEDYERQGRIRFNPKARETLDPYVIDYRRKDGGVFVGETVGAPIRNSTGELIGFISVIRDITERLRREDSLRESESRLAEACRIAKIGHWIWDEKEDRQLYCSEEGERIFGVPPGTVFANFDELLAMTHPDDRQLVKDVMDQAYQDRTGYEVEYRIIRADGETRYVLEHADVEFDESGEIVRTIGTVQDITERKEAKKRVKHLAHNVALTGLPNRNLFEDRLEKAMAHAQRHGQKLAVHFMDLNRFKEVNDTLGHAVGDELLKAVGATLQAVVRDTDSVARFGGDECTVVQTELTDPQDATILAQKLIDALGRPFQLAGHEVRTGATIGVAVYPHDGTESAQLLQNADFALYAGKAKGQNTFEFFDADMRATLAARKKLEEDLARAVERQEFMVYYQPRIDLAGGLIIGVEALVRWRHPERGIVSPGEFIPVAETSGLIRPLGEWVLRTACADTAAWREAGLPPLSVAVNLSAAQFHHTDLVGLVSQVLDSSGLTPGQLELEITETMMMNERDTKVVPTLRQLRDLGIQISIDDFGTGYASLTYLRQFPVTKVKIDMSFVQGITHDPADKAIVEAVIRLGHGLKLEVTAEGVETEDQAALLSEWNCDEAQGYLFSRPVPADELTALLEPQAAERRASSGPSPP